MQIRSSFYAKTTLLVLAALLLAPHAQAFMPHQRFFASPDQAARALIEADNARGSEALLRILGPQARDLISSGDPVADARGRQKFAAAYDARHVWEDDGVNRKILVVGTDRWPLPIPLVHENGGWHFDTAAGRQEILDRRIGRNELKVMEICRAIVLAEKDYAAQEPARGVFAARFISTPGKHDGLFWETKPGEPESPLGPLVAQAADEGYPQPHKGNAHKQHIPYHGYFYRILKAQGPAAPGGAKDYIVKGRMTGGFALLAYPAKYGASGVRSFLVDETGIIYQKDLGPKTADIAAAMTRFNPDRSWQIPQTTASLHD